MTNSSDQWVAIYTRYVVPALGFIGALICLFLAGYFFANGDPDRGWMLVGFAVIGGAAIVVGQLVIRKRGMYKVK
ncbi:hypothetical protein [Marisediminicola sp. LYQ134]|uniref:hypothetical protein n=1 Tax=Marisediminicola sp. LYQ134 TaxID=3391061 RepID=UPI003983DA59